MDFSPPFYLYFTIQFLCVVVSLWWLLKRRDELPLIASVFLFYVFSFRFWALLHGWTNPVNLSNFGFENATYEDLLAAQGLGALGESVFLLAYLLTQKRAVYVPRVVLSGNALGGLRAIVFIGITVCIPLALVTRAFVSEQIAAGKSVAFEVSNYLNLFPLALVGLAILMGALWRAGAFNDFISALWAALSLLAVAVLTFQPSLRFQFLGWVLAVTVIVSSGETMKRKGSILIAGLIFAATCFAIQGALRNAEDPDVDVGATAWERFAFAQDANMLDGFVLVRQVYPEMLDFSYGTEHLEILQRPIPRAWWPDKPVGGYMNKLGIIDVRTGFTLGISPSLFGSFYQEGDIYGLILLSALYGFGFGRLVRWSTEVLPFAGLVIRGCACAALIPLLRGGDLPGIYAWFGMSFWPVGLIMWIKRREFFHRPKSDNDIKASDALTIAGRSR